MGFIKGGINMMDMEKGLYEVKIERENMFFNSWTGTPKDVEVKYVFVNDFKAFEKWLSNIYTEGNEQGIKFREVRRVDYRKVSETIIILNEKGGINMMDMEKGLYEVEIERENMLFNSWTGTPKDVEVKYVFVNDCEAFEKWLTNIYTEGNEQGIKFREVRRIDYRKVSETIMVLN